MGSHGGEYSSYKFGYLARFHDEKEINKLTPEEKRAIDMYTDPKIAVKLNKAIREHNLSNDGVAMRDLIISAVRKCHVVDKIRLFRGISVSYEVYQTKFYIPFLLKEKIIGSQVCSTSMRMERAFLGAENGNKEKMAFCLLLTFQRDAMPPISKASHNTQKKKNAY